MKYFLITLLVLTSFFATAQDGEVRLPNKVAIFYLERAEISYMQEELIAGKNAIIINLEQTVETAKSLAESFKRDNAILRNMLELKAEENEIISNLLISARKEIRRQKIQKIVIIAGTVVVVIILL